MNIKYLESTELQQNPVIIKPKIDIIFKGTLNYEQHNTLVNELLREARLFDLNAHCVYTKNRPYNDSSVLRIGLTQVHDFDELENVFNSELYKYLRELPYVAMIRIAPHKSKL